MAVLVSDGDFFERRELHYTGSILVQHVSVIRLSLGKLLVNFLQMVKQTNTPLP